MKNPIPLLILVLALATAFVPGLRATPYQMENLGRGVIAMRTDTNSVYVGWRQLGLDPSGISYNVYRGSTLVNASPITNSTNLVDTGATLSVANTYTVRPVIGGVEQAASAGYTLPANAATQQFLNLPLQIPAGGTTPSGEAYTYSANDCSLGDVDGDGEYEIILKWDPSNSKDNSLSGYTGNVYIDAYKLNGTRLWRIDLGRNIRAGAHYTQFLVYDFDGDGKAEMMCKTAPGTVSGTGVNVLMGSDSATADYRNSSGYVLTGPEYLTVFNGQTGAAMATTAYLPARGTVSSWGDSYGNRVDRFIACVAYLDGTRPSAVFGRGYYTRLVRVAWDWRNGQLTQRWNFDSNTSGNSAYAGQGNHQLTVGDVDGDGKDEVCNGSSAINDNGTGLYANGLGHGDAMHMSVLDPSLSGQQVFQCHEIPGQYGNYGIEFRNAQTGTPIWGYLGTGGDVGRACAGDVDPNYPGAEVWGSNSGLMTCKGVQITTSKPTTNFMVWWDADMLRECLDGATISKWDYTNFARVTMFAPTGVTSNNTTKATPCLSADIFGDWREEVILRTTDNTALRIFTTTIVATNRFYTLMHDHQYRLAIAWQNGAYNQPPWPSFFIGNGMAAQPAANITYVNAPLPAAPSNLAASAGSSTQINLTWTDNASNETGFTVDRATDSSFSAGLVSSTVGANVSSFSATGLSAGTTYFFRVRASNTAGSSANSNTASATTPAGGTSVTIQAENGVLAGGPTIDSNNAGFNGTGFVNFPTTGGSVQFNNVDGGTGGSRTLTVRYALGVTTARVAQLVVNGVTTNLTFAPSGAWTTWVTVSASITLNSGTGNTIRIQSNGQDAGNVDQITVSNP